MALYKQNKKQTTCTCPVSLSTLQMPFVPTAPQPTIFLSDRTYTSGTEGFIWICQVQADTSNYSESGQRPKASIFCIPLTTSLAALYWSSSIADGVPVRPSSTRRTTTVYQQLGGGGGEEGRLLKVPPSRSPLYSK